MIPFSTTLSRAARSGLKPTPSSMNVDRRPFIQICRCRRRRCRPGTSAACSCRCRCARRSRRTRPAHVEGDVLAAPGSVWWRVRRSGCSARSLSVCVRSSGTRKVLVTDWRRRRRRGAGRRGHLAVPWQRCPARLDSRRAGRWVACARCRPETRSECSACRRAFLSELEQLWRLLRGLRAAARAALDANLVGEVQWALGAVARDPASPRRTHGR